MLYIYFIFKILNNKFLVYCNNFNAVTFYIFYMYSLYSDFKYKKIIIILYAFQIKKNIYNN